MWDAGNDEQEVYHRAYVPVPGFGEYYTPPSRSEEKSGTQRSPSKLENERMGMGQWRPRQPQCPPPRTDSDSATASPPFLAEPPTSPPPEQEATANEGAMIRYDDADEELVRLRAMWAVFQKALFYVRWLLPITGGLACWVTAAQNFGSGGTLAAFQPMMIGAVTLSMFAFVIALGASAFSGGYVFLTLLARVLRQMFFGGRNNSSNTNYDYYEDGSGYDTFYGDYRPPPVDYLPMKERVAAAVERGAVEPMGQENTASGQTVRPLGAGQGAEPIYDIPDDTDFVTMPSPHSDPSTFASPPQARAQGGFPTPSPLPRVDLPIEPPSQNSTTRNEVWSSASRSPQSRGSGRIDSYDNGWDGSAPSAWKAQVASPTEPAGAATAPDLSRFQRLRRGDTGAMGSLRDTGASTIDSVDPVIASLAWDRPPPTKSDASAEFVDAVPATFSDTADIEPNAERLEWPPGSGTGDTAWQDMKQRRDDWQRRVQRAVRRKTDENSQ